MALPGWLEGKSDEEVISALRAEVDNDHNRLADREKLTFFHELVDESEVDLAAEWDAYGTTSPGSPTRTTGTATSARWTRFVPERS